MHRVNSTRISVNIASDNLWRLEKKKEYYIKIIRTEHKRKCKVSTKTLSVPVCIHTGKHKRTKKKSEAVEKEKKIF